jgi:hypothetical protein
MGLNLTDQTTFQEGWVKSQLPAWVSLPLPLTPQPGQAFLSWPRPWPLSGSWLSPEPINLYPILIPLADVW